MRTETQGDYLESQILAAEQALSDGQPEEAERLLRDALATRPDHPDAMFLLGDALRDQGRLEEAEGTYKALVLAAPDDADAWAALAASLMFQLRWDSARRAANRALREEAHHPEASYVRGVLRERRGDYSGAQRDFIRAYLGAPTSWPLPVPLDDETVERVVGDALEALHPTLREYLADIPILLEEVPPEDILRQYDPPAYPTEILGYFSGHSLMDRSIDNPWSSLPGAIVLFRRNLSRFARDRPQLIEELRVTLFHEVGHFLGLNEDDLQARGLD